MIPHPVPLRTRLFRHALAPFGAPEHGQFHAILAKATAFSLDHAAAKAVADTLEHRASSVERNVDLLRLPASAVWLEWPDSVRRRASQPLDAAGHPVTVGALVCAAPGAEDVITVMTAWDFPDGSTRHSYAAANLDVDDLSRHAFRARRGFGTGREEVLARLLDRTHVYLPAGLDDELGAMVRIDGGNQGAEEAVRLSAKRDVASEVPFVLAALLLLQTDSATRAMDPDDGHCRIGVEARPRTVREMLFRAPGGFVRSGNPAAPRLDWRRPG